jgi:hypothetical protein
VRTTGSLALMLLLFLTSALRLDAQDQAIAARYSPEQLNCARFLESSESTIHTVASGRTREQTAGRRGVWQFRAAPLEDEITVEGWLDSLTVWRSSQETTVKPDTDGLLGGRYRGTLSRAGDYESRARPFVPDEVGEVAGMGTALDDFFPPLPTRPLAPGQVWNDSPGVTIRRLPDSALSGVPLYRFELGIRRETRVAPTTVDTLPLKVRQTSQEQGTFVWHPHLGLLQRERRIVVETVVPANRRVRQPVRSKVEQRITVRRDLESIGQTAEVCGSAAS